MHLLCKRLMYLIASVSCSCFRQNRHTGDRAKVRELGSKRISDFRPRLHISFSTIHQNTGDTSANCRIFEPLRFSYFGAVARTLPWYRSDCSALKVLGRPLILQVRHFKSWSCYCGMVIMALEAAPELETLRRTVQVGRCGTALLLGRKCTCLNPDPVLRLRKLTLKILRIV